jgi:hypothetical protein
LFLCLFSDRLIVMSEYFMPTYKPGERPSLRAVLDALDDGGSADGCDPDWCAEVLANALPEDIRKVKEMFEREASCGKAEAGVSESGQSDRPIPEAATTAKWAWMSEF